ncbi:16S rRNA (guanine(966)-N(2))-methyltransferase RsmD [Dehalococcoides sp. THU3]|uniref:16S rRNA (guanine(966)-N(2))-methyltransferase RsmD n=1 Tax=Dehalococcoides TaxID=61434 RepID=UPI0005B56C88|nr:MULTISPECIES: 16S rRNA (guanine(966)-N(2))-methyltransferase RsmD [Dehalococcoides]QYY58515.1 16S rRNA (guanine(966)-N(2))-methyltransferase RsmD [Dehalococcoides mccartyi]BAQ34177.1 putative methyltransferase [Dehalococcoides sp. UCH007]
MRIIAGDAKGKNIIVPQRKATRPATELVRGAMMSMLEAIAEDWSEVLDIYSGSGSLGLEALSRGAGHVDFVEHERCCCDIIKQNLETIGCASQAHVYCLDVPKAIAFLKKQYDVILADPPYRNQQIGEVLEKLGNSGLIGESTVMAVTHSAHLTLAERYGQLKMLKEHRHGDSLIAIYRKDSSFDSHLPGPV